MRFVEDDDAVEGVAVGFAGSGGQPLDDLVEARAVAVTGRRAQGCVGGEEDPFRARDVVLLAEVRELDDVVGGSADGLPVPAGVLDELVGLREPQRAAAPPQPAVEDDGGYLAALAAAGAVAEHPALAEPDRGPEPGLVADGRGVVLVRDGVVGCGDPADELVVGADAEERRQVLLVRVRGQDDALELRVGQCSVDDEPGGQQRFGARLRVGHGGHRGRLHQGGRVRRGAVDHDRGGTPGMVGAVAGAVGRVCRRRSGAVSQRCGLAPLAGQLVGERRAFARAPLADWGRSLRRRRPSCGLRRLTPGRQPVEDRAQQVVRRRHRAGHGRAGLGCGCGLAGQRLLQHAQPGVVGGAPPLVQPAVDGGREEDIGRRVGLFEGGVPVAAGGDAAGRGDGDQASPGTQRLVGGAHVAQVGVVAHALDVGAAREGRVHEHDARTDVREQVPDALGVVAGDLGVGEQSAQQACPHRGQLVQVQAPAGLRVEAQVGQRGQHAGAG